MRAFQRERSRRRRQELTDRLVLARRDAERIVEMLVRDHDPVRIWQWGSVLAADTFWEHSDIDLAVEGFRSAEEFFAAYGKAEALTDFPVDLVEMEKVHPLHAARIRARGRLVHERGAAYAR